jgi:hypothetical protein
MGCRPRRIVRHYLYTLQYVPAAWLEPLLGFGWDLGMPEIESDVLNYGYRSIILRKHIKLYIPVHIVVSYSVCSYCEGGRLESRC